MKSKIVLPIFVLIISLACSSVTISIDAPVATSTPNMPETALPDLVITPVYVSTVGLNGQCLGNYYASASVLNQGNAPADNVIVLELATGHTIIVGRLEAGQKMDLQVPAGSPTGNYTLQADPQNLVVESNENNNIVSTVLATATPVMDCLMPTLTPWDVPSFTPTLVMSELTLWALQNASYHSNDWGDFTLTDGVYFRPLPTAQDSPEAYTTRMTSNLFYGDMNFDGWEDAGVILATQNGGTGHFYELALMLNQNGIPYNISTVSLGDRVAIQTGIIRDGILHLTLLTHGPDDGLCCPSQLAVMKFQLDGNQLIRIP
jgi:hypothetical protein